MERNQLTQNEAIGGIVRALERFVAGVQGVMGCAEDWEAEKNQAENALADYREWVRVRGSRP